MKYVLLGANGTSAKAVAAELAARQIPFRVVARSADALERNFSRYGALAQRVAADLSNADDARTALRGAECAFYLIGAPYNRFALHPSLARIAIAAAKADGLDAFIHLSNVYPYGRPQAATVSEAQPCDPHTFKGRMRKEQEEIVLAAHAKGELRTAILRAPDFYGPDAEQSLTWQIFTAASKGTRAITIGPIDTPHEFIFVPDLARTLVDLSLADGAYGRAWNVAGPETITVRQFARRIYGKCGRKPKLFVLGRTSLRIIGTFDPIMREFVEMEYLQRTPVNLDDTRLRALLPGLVKTTYDEGIAKTLDAIRARLQTVA